MPGGRTGEARGRKLEGVCVFHCISQYHSAWAHWFFLPPPWLSTDCRHGPWGSREQSPLSRRQSLDRGSLQGTDADHRPVTARAGTSVSPHGQRTALWGEQQSKSSGTERGSCDEVQAEGVHPVGEEAAPANKGTVRLPQVPAVPCHSPSITRVSPQALPAGPALQSWPHLEAAVHFHLLKTSE